MAIQLWSAVLSHYILFQDGLIIGMIVFHYGGICFILKLGTIFSAIFHIYRTVSFLPTPQELDRSFYLSLWLHLFFWVTISYVLIVNCISSRHQLRALKRPNYLVTVMQTCDNKRWMLTIHHTTRLQNSVITILRSYCVITYRNTRVALRTLPLYLDGSVVVCRELKA